MRCSATPGTATRQASLSITKSRSSPKLMSIELVMPSSHLILCRPLLLLPPNPSQHHLPYSDIDLTKTRVRCLQALRSCCSIFEDHSSNTYRGCSSAGRAPALQAGGQGFESLHLHHRLKNRNHRFKERTPREAIPVIVQITRAHSSEG